MAFPVSDSSECLAWVSAELTASLRDARNSLEAFVDAPDERAPLGDVAVEMQKIHGALRVVEAQGAVLLAQEMVHVAGALYEGSIKDAREGLEALSRAIVQLPAYLDRLQAGGRDIPLLLLPLLNDLRAVRGSPLLSENTLFILNLDNRQGSPSAPQPSGSDVVAVARKLRPRYQAALLGWLRGEHIDSNLATMGAVLTNIEQAASVEALFQLSWVAGAIIEALREDGLDGSVAIKRLLGQIDRQLKTLIDSGETRFATDPPSQLINNLLYYAARARAGGRRLDAVRQAYSLAEILPDEEQLQAARETLAGPSAQLMETVAAAIRQDLSHVKDVLDIYVRTGKNDLDDIAAQSDTLKRIGDTLAMLGLGDLRAAVLEQKECLESWVNGELPADDEMLASAGVLLSVEDALASELIELLNADAALAADQADDDGGEDTENSQSMRESEFLAVIRAVLRECLVNLSRVKESITQFLDAQTHSLDNVPALLRAINAGLLMLGKSRAVGVIDRIADYTRAELRGQGAAEVNHSELDLLAEAIVSVEFYLEALRNGRADDWNLLDNAVACLDVIAPRDPTAKLPVPPPTPVPEANDAALTAAGASTATFQTPMRGDAGDIDPELLETFIEEADEEIAALQLSWPDWRNEPEDNALAPVRRSFHTLKGSGRMVGASMIGELCWAVESRLNKHLNGTLPLDKEAISQIDDAVGALPQLLQQLKLGTPPRTDISAIVKRLEAGTSEPAAVAGARPVARPVATSGMDPVLYEIFSAETATHLDRIEEFLATARGAHRPPALTEELHRAWHTLSGSASMAGAEPVVLLADPVQRYVRGVLDDGVGIDQQALAVIADAAAAIRTIVARLDDDRAPEPDRALLDRIKMLGNALPDAETPIDDARTDEVTATDSEPVDELVSRETTADGDDGLDEIAAIFGDEAVELMESADLALQRLRHDVTDRSSFNAIKRHLHTIKGGARMAGVSALGDLSHELETLLQSIDGVQRRADAAVVALIQEGLDRMHAMAELLRARQDIPAAADLIGRIRSMAVRPAASPPPAVLPSSPPSPPSPPERSAKRASIGAPASGQATDATGTKGTPADSLYDEVPDSEAKERNIDSDRTPTPPVARPSPPAPIEVSAAGQDRTAARELFADETGERQEYARVSAEVLDDLLNNVGEVSIYHSRMEQQINTIGFNTAELARTVVRLREQLRRLEMETEAQVLHRHHEAPDHRSDFDPLEMDRYSTIQQLSRALAESVGDLSSIQGLLDELTRDAETLLAQQSRVTTELQDGLMRTRMVPFERHVPRFSRLVRQVAAESGKRAGLIVEGGGELDRQVLDRMLAPFEHLLRNAVIHGIEPPELRAQRGKPETGTITISIAREGSEMVIVLRDDGAGLDLSAIRAKAAAQGLISPEQPLTDAEILQLVLEPGFTTASEVTQSAGRGVGMDVVANVVKQLGGLLSIQSVYGRGASFTIRLPVTLAITQALLIRTGEEIYAIPVLSLAGVARVPTAELRERLESENPQFDYGGATYQLQHLGHLLGTHGTDLDAAGSSVALVLVRAAEHSTALLADEIVGSREVVVKPVGPQIAAVRGVAGATILGDGSIVVILDVNAMVRRAVPPRARPDAAKTRRDERPTVLVVDDSITVRRVTQRLLERHDMRVVTAKDGVDAVSAMQEVVPDLILLDIEMPRMDGYEVATHVRNSPRLQQVPIVMITSRVGDKHRNRALELGVNAYLGKPYQEVTLLDTIGPLLAGRGALAAKT